MTGRGVTRGEIGGSVTGGRIGGGVTEDQGDGFIGLACGGDDEALIVPDRLEPSIDVGGAASEGIGGFEAAGVEEEGRAHLGNKLLLGVMSVTEVNVSGRDSIEAGRMTGRVRELVEGGAVVGGGVLELSHERKVDGVLGGLVESFAALAVNQLDAAAGEVSLDDGFGLRVRINSVIEGDCRVLLRNPFALRDMEDVVVTEVRNLFDLAGFFVFLFKPLPEDDDAGFLAFAYVTAFVLALLKREIFARLTVQKDLIKKSR